MATVGVWEDWDLIEVHEFEISKTTEIQACIQAMRIKHKIPKHNCIADADGVGGGVVDNLDIIGFVNNAKPFEENTGQSKNAPKYKNMQTQLLVYLAEKIINQNKMNISADISEKQKEYIKEELDTIERIPDVDIVTLVDKTQIKQNIGRSPDYRDMILMRCYFDFKNPDRVDLKTLGRMLG